MTNNQLTAEQLVTLQLRIMSALSFYRQRPEKEARRMAELLELAGAAASELQERRAAMPQESPKGAGAPQDCRSNENVQVVDRQSVDHVDGVMAPPITRIKPVADLYEVTVPSGRSTTFTTDAAEAKDCADMGWKVQEYVTLEHYQEAVTGNSPVTPDGWIPVSERMPEVGDVVLTAIDGCVNVGEAERSGANYRYFTSVISGRELPATHWQPLPAAPKEVG